MLTILLKDFPESNFYKFWSEEVMRDNLDVKN